VRKPSIPCAEINDQSYRSLSTFEDVLPNPCYEAVWCVDLTAIQIERNRCVLGCARRRAVLSDVKER
jgi:hypothetical protein